MITDITQQFSADLAKKIFANKKNALTYLLILNKTTPVLGLFNDSGKVCKMTSSELWGLVVNTWSYELAKPIIRDLFRQTNKYKRGTEASHAVGLLREEWEKMNLGNFEWPFSQGDFDNFVQRINSTDDCSQEKDDKVKIAAVKFRRIKEINTYRNDYIETLIFEKSDAILPTLCHNRGVDFFINGISFDQKVSRSVTNEFKKDHKENWKSAAIGNPLEVAKYLYSLQDENRFDANPRLLVVYVDEDISANTIEQKIAETDFYHPGTVRFSYNHKIHGEKSYATPCITILLHN